MHHASEDLMSDAETAPCGCGSVSCCKRATPVTEPRLQRSGFPGEGTPIRQAFTKFNSGPTHQSMRALSGFEYRKLEERNNLTRTQRE
jgi:hypothetical protein